MNELYKKTAIEVVNLLKRKTISPLEVVEHAISRIEAIDQHVNALPIRCFERAIEQAKSFKNIPKSQMRQLPFLNRMVQSLLLNLMSLNGRVDTLLIQFLVQHETPGTLI